MQLDVHNSKVEKVSTVEVPDTVFAAPVRKALLWEIVKSQLASRRRGTHKTKNRGEVSGGGAKPFKQKGTGRARQGSSRSPNLVGGGVSMGPTPRDYSFRLPRSARKAALCSALSSRVKEDNLIVIDSLVVDAPRTKYVVEFLSNLGSSSALIVDIENSNLKLSARNIQKSKYLSVDGLNVYDILNYEKLVITQAALGIAIAKAESAGDQVSEA